MNTVETTLKAAKSLIPIGNEFHARGWSVGTSSNYSRVVSQEPLQLVVTASGKDKGRLTESDFARVDASGKPIDADAPKSSAETLLHVAIAQQFPSVTAILHTHSIWGTLLSRRFGDAGGFTLAGFEMLKGLEGIKTHETRYFVPIFENTQDIPTLVAQLEARFSVGDEAEDAIHHGFLIRGHGLYTWGDDLFAARRHIEIFEFLFECFAREQGLG
ncbi:MAG: methylthioribulose 1-phosphate dehydratase [Planctomycetota bacterium]